MAAAVDKEQLQAEIEVLSERLRKGKDEYEKQAKAEGRPVDVRAFLSGDSLSKKYPGGPICLPYVNKPTVLNLLAGVSFQDWAATAVGCGIFYGLGFQHGLSATRAMRLQFSGVEVLRLSNSRYCSATVPCSSDTRDGSAIGKSPRRYPHDPGDLCGRDLGHEEGNVAPHGLLGERDAATGRVQELQGGLHRAILCPPRGV